MGYEFVHQRRVEFSETDMAGIVHFANFMRWMEVTEHAFLRSLGFSVHVAAGAASTGWPRLKVGCEYLKPLRFEEEFEIVLSIKEVRNRSVCYGFVFRRKTDGEPVAKGEVVAVHAAVESATGALQACPIPEGLRAKLLGLVSSG